MAERGQQFDADRAETQDAVDAAAVFKGGWHIHQFTGTGKQLGHTIPYTPEMVGASAKHYGYGSKN